MCSYFPLGNFSIAGTGQDTENPGFSNPEVTQIKVIPGLTEKQAELLVFPRREYKVYKVGYLRDFKSMPAFTINMFSHLKLNGTGT